jgi:hypothetical protein
MKTAPKVAVYGLALVIVFGGAWAAGAAAGPLGGTTQPSGPDPARHGQESAETLPPGLSVAENGYTLRLTSDTVTSGTTQQFQFHISGPDATPVTTFAVEHDKRLHLVLVRRDGSGFQHLHPEMAPDGTWTTPLTLPEAGSYRVFADFRPDGGPKTTLGADIQVPGAFGPRQYTTDNRSSTVDGYTVTLSGDLQAGAESVVTASVAKDGLPVTDLQPYLGANGHLVALRSADLAYLHVHPQAAPGHGPDVTFAVDVPTNGRYRLFLDFQHENQVRTAQFTLHAGGSPGTAAPPSAPSDGHTGHGG